MQVEIDAVGNVVGIYHGSDPAARRLLTGSHYDTVRNGGKYDGRLGILVPMACVRVSAVGMANVTGMAVTAGMSAEARDGHRAQAYDTEQQTRDVQIHVDCAAALDPPSITRSGVIDGGQEITQALRRELVPARPRAPGLPRAAGTR